MKKIIKRTAFIVAFIMVFCISYGDFNVSAADEFRDMGTRLISNLNKTWTLKFNTPVNVGSLVGNVKINDVTSGSTAIASVSAGNDQYSAKVNPPSGGYKMGHNYKLIVDKGAKSKGGENLSKPVTLNFNLTSDGKYSATANVEVSSAFNSFKQITVSTNLPFASKYKIEGNDNLFDIGKTAVSFVPQSQVQIYLYDNKGNLLGTSTLNVSSTKSNIRMNITLAN